MTSDAPPLFPIGLVLTGRACLVVGGGDGSVRRARALLDAGARVHVVSDPPDAALRDLASEGAISLSPRGFEDRDLDGVWLAVLTDLNATLAERMAQLAETARVLFCAVDQPKFANYSHPALVRSGPVTVAISTNGRAPALARRLREELERVLVAAKLGSFAERLGALRDATPSPERRKILGEAVRDVRLTGALILPNSR